MPQLRDCILVAALLVGTVPSYAETNVFQQVVAARGGCINIHTIEIHGDTGLLRRNFSFGETDGKLYGKPVLKWSDHDVADAVRFFRNCWAKKVALQGPDLQSYAERQSTDFENVLRQVVTAARNAEAQNAAKQAAQLELKKAKAQSEREQKEEEARRKQAQLAEQARLDREAAEQARQLVEREAPKMAEAAKEAEDARRVRQAAEQKLAEIRDRVDAQISARNEALAHLQRIEVARQREIERRDELKDDEKLSQPCKILLQQFNEAKLGMHLREVERLFGCKGTQVSASRYGGSVVETYSWRGSTDQSSVTASFEESLLRSKMQFGLE